MFNLDHLSNLSLILQKNHKFYFDLSSIHYFLSLIKCSLKTSQRKCFYFTFTSNYLWLICLSFLFFSTDLSPGLAALTVGCDSGDLGSLSRVQLLLLDRKGSESPGPIPSPEWCCTLDGEEYEPGLRVWSSGIPQYYQSTGTLHII